MGGDGWRWSDVGKDKKTQQGLSMLVLLDPPRCVSVCEPIPPAVPAVGAGRLVKLGAGRLSFFLSVSGAC